MVRLHLWNAIYAKLINNGFIVSNSVVHLVNCGVIISNRVVNVGNNGVMLSNIVLKIVKGVIRSTFLVQAGNNGVIGFKLVKTLSHSTADTSYHVVSINNVQTRCSGTIAWYLKKCKCEGSLTQHVNCPYAVECPYCFGRR